VQWSLIRTRAVDSDQRALVFGKDKEVEDLLVNSFYIGIFFACMLILQICRK